ncbi:methyl-accepting chemotaxis protein [Psychrobacillus sp. FSL H8-0483]|uniref:methyl-accepting chemotaxis protein n=1 Tax=Psychrobacillus sp. FSL H8-0483 TaxID=2921389 RepID=UPI00315B2F32
MNIFKKLSFVTKSIATTTALILLVGVVLIVSSLKVQNGVLTTEMEKQATEIAVLWGKTIDPKLVEDAANEKDFDDKAQTELIAMFDNISKTNPNVAQGYLFTSELIEGNKSAIIANPTHIVEVLKENNMKIGDLNEHPKATAEAIRKMNETKEITASEIYDDLLGTWITVMYPIKNSSGEVFAFFGVDVDASMVKNGTKEFLFNSLLILIPAMIIIVLIQVIFTRRSFKPLKQLSFGINEMRNGNLDIKLPTREDDLGKINEAFNEMAYELKSMIQSIRKTSDTVLQSSELVTKVTDQSKDHSIKISENIKEMTAGIQAQEVSVTESASAIEQIANEIGSIANSSQDVTVISKNMEDYAEQGLDAISKVVSQMEIINDTVQNSSNIIGLLKERSDEITSILDVITGISNQTNLLALNAAIEAARAGEHGKGFSVVAQEVRILAEESSKSTEKISKIIEEIQNETKNAVSSMKIGTIEADKGTKIAHTTGEMFVKIKEIADQISNQIEGVSAASQEISAGTEEVSASVNDLTAIAQKNSHSTYEIEGSTMQQVESINQLSDAAKELNVLAYELQSMITKFKA